MHAASRLPSFLVPPKQQHRKQHRKPLASMPAPSNLQQLQNMLFLSLLCVTFSSGVHALRQLRQGSTPVAVTDPSGKFGAAPADSADCSSVCQSALGMADVDAGVSGQQACAVYLEQAWLPGITSTDDFKNHADYGKLVTSAS